MLDARIVNEDVGPAQLIGAASHHALDRFRIGQVGPVVKRPKLIAEGCDLIRVAETVDHQGGAGVAERFGDRETDPGRRSGDQRDFAFETHRLSFGRASRLAAADLQPVLGSRITLPQRETGECG